MPYVEFGEVRYGVTQEVEPRSEEKSDFVRGRDGYGSADTQKNALIVRADGVII
jgi:hypothetical protein